jgi:galactokinase/mevalonate kinase-like predicted kinase
MTTETKLRAGLAMTLLGLIMMTFLYFEKDRVYQEIKVSSSKQIDSLRDELFIKFTEISRYEITLEIFKEQNKKAADEFELILTTQTE